jgi:hypothetical protein
VQAAVESTLVFGANVDRRYEKYAAYGDTIVVPVLSNISASAFNAAADISFTTTTENAVNISIDKRYYAAFGVDDFTREQDALSYFDKAKAKIAYGLSKQIDQDLASLVTSLGNNVGTEGSALTIDVLIDAYESVNENDAPEQDRCWIFDPESITDLLKLDYFVRMDYVPESVHRRGFSGRQIFGAPVYMTTNLPAVNTSYHAAVYMHKECFALVMQLQPRIRLERHTPRLADVLVGEALYGVKEMRDGYGVWIKTRS